MLSLGIWMLAGWLVLAALIALGFLIWAWRNGQFKDIEEAKYRMLDNKEPEPWPERKGGKE
jgi:cbb3-type cytochrome oxidase maturation protein